MQYIGKEIYYRFNDTCQWSYGILIGETNNGFEIYCFCCKEEKYIEYVGQISPNPHQINAEILISNKFTNRNTNNYNFLN